MNRQEHWDKIYKTKAPDQVSWYKPHLGKSLSLIQSVCADRTQPIVDVGAGECTLVDDLLTAGYENVTVLDISQVAVNVAKDRLGKRAELVDWRVADVLQSDLPERYYAVWHDRAVFHFLTDETDRAKYVQQVVNAMKVGGYVIIATFGPQGPEKCSGLNVVRYDQDSLHQEFGPCFRLIESSTELHETPFGTIQQFLYCCCKVE